MLTSRRLRLSHGFLSEEQQGIGFRTALLILLNIVIETTQNCQGTSFAVFRRPGGARADSLCTQLATLFRLSRHGVSLVVPLISHRLPSYLTPFRRFKLPSLALFTSWSPFGATGPLTRLGGFVSPSPRQRGVFHCISMPSPTSLPLE